MTVSWNDLDSGWNIATWRGTSMSLKLHGDAFSSLLLQHLRKQDFRVVKSLHLSRRWTCFAVVWCQGSHFAGWRNAQTIRNNVLVLSASVTWTWLMLWCLVLFCTAIVLLFSAASHSVASVCACVCECVSVWVIVVYRSGNDPVKMEH